MKKFIFTLLFIFGIGIMLSPFIKDMLVSYVSEKSLDISSEEIRKNQEEEVTYNFEDITPIDISDIVSALNSDLLVIGKIEVPSVDLSLPIIKGVSNSAMSAGAATLREDQQMGKGNYPLASHHMKSPNLLFSPLDRVELGDKIYLIDSEKEYVYQVIEKEIISPESVEVIEDKEGETLVTLITCNVDGTKRLMVIGELIEINKVE